MMSIFKLLNNSFYYQHWLLPLSQAEALCLRKHGGCDNCLMPWRLLPMLDVKWQEPSFGIKVWLHPAFLKGMKMAVLDFEE